MAVLDYVQIRLIFCIVPKKKTRQIKPSRYFEDLIILNDECDFTA